MTSTTTRNPFTAPVAPAERQATLARIRALCTLPHGDGGCWLWRGANAGAKSNRPVLSYRGCKRAVRIVVYFLRHGCVPPPGTCATGCGVPGCVSPHHVQALTLQAILRRSAGAGRCSPPGAHAARKAAAQARVRYDDATIAHVRTLTCPAAEAARITGISRTHVINIRAGRTRTPLDVPPPPPRTPRQVAAAARAVERTRAQRLARLRSRQAVAGVWAGLLPA